MSASPPDWKTGSGGPFRCEAQGVVGSAVEATAGPCRRALWLWHRWQLAGSLSVRVDVVGLLVAR